MEKRYKEIQTFFQKVVQTCDYMLYGCSGIDCVIETERFDLLKQEMDGKLRVLQKDIFNQAFSDKMKSLAIKMKSIMTFYDQAVRKGDDGHQVCRQRFDSMFVHLDQVLITITDETGPLYDRAHCCLDFVSQFLILHMGLLMLAEEDYELSDYRE